jgi:hypothetical protein
VGERQLNEPKPCNDPERERVSYEYGEPVHGITGLARLSLRIRQDPAIAKEEQFRQDVTDC